MRLERLELKGFMRFRAPLALDLVDVPSGLVAITGENGAGKSTMLDAGLAAPFLAFPSREGNLADYATDRDAYLDVRYALEGRGTFRARVNVDGQKRTSDAVLEQLTPDGRGIPLNDGKVSTFKEAVARIFPPKDLILASAFAAQNRAGSFVALDRRGKKDLFSALLGLKHYERMAETAKKCGQAIDGARLKLDARRLALEADTDAAVADELHARAEALQVERTAAELRLDALRADLARLEAQVVQLRADAQANAVAEAEFAAASAAIQTASQAMNDLARREEQLRAQHDREIRHVEERLAETAREAARRSDTGRQTTEAAKADLARRIDNNRRVLADAEAIRDAVRQQEAAKATIAATHEALAAARGERDLALEQQRLREQLLVKVDQADTAIANAERQAALVDQVPCHGAGDCGACQFLTDAREAQAAIPDLQHVAGQRRAFEEGRDHWRAVAADTATRIAALEATLQEAQKAAAAHEAKAKLDPHVAAATARIEEYERQLAELDVALVHLLADIEGDVARHAAQLRDSRLAHEFAFSQHSAALADERQRLGEAYVQAEAAEAAAREAYHRTSGARQQLDALEAEQAQARVNERETAITLTLVQSKAEALERDRARYRAKCEERAHVERRLQEAEQEWLGWSLLVKAFGRDGLPTLEIDAAGPTVSRITNDLLAACFGPRFTVELVTQEDKADGKGTKEAFDLHVYDNQAGGAARAIGDLSGGERVIVEEALRAAIALFVNSRNEQPIRTLWRDETTGALDPENAVRYVAMLRRLLELGGYTHILFITHNPDAATLADARVTVADGQAVVQAA